MNLIGGVDVKLIELKRSVLLVCPVALISSSSENRTID